jgi:hypothetical protein
VSFWNLMWLMVKMALASIPAFIILLALGLVIAGVLAAALGINWR